MRRSATTSEDTVPLRPGEHDVVLQLQSLIDDCYRDRRHFRTDYERDPTPALSPDDAAMLGEAKNLLQLLQ